MKAIPFMCSQLRLSEAAMWGHFGVVEHAQLLISARVCLGRRGSGSRAETSALRALEGRSKHRRLKVLSAAGAR